MNFSDLSFTRLKLRCHQLASNWEDLRRIYFQAPCDRWSNSLPCSCRTDVSLLAVSWGPPSEARSLSLTLCMGPQIPEPSREPQNPVLRLFLSFSLPHLSSSSSDAYLWLQACKCFSKANVVKLELPGYFRIISLFKAQ